MKTILLTKNKFAIVDNEDFDTLSKYSWQTKVHGKTFYAKTSIRLKNGKRKAIGMHQMLMAGKVSDGKEIDHINGNGIDNRKSNLRVCTHAENTRNRTGKDVGIHWHKISKKWQARIMFDGKTYSRLCSTKKEARKLRKTLLFM